MSKKIKKTSAAIFFTNGIEFLAISPTNYNYWEIPKGIIEKNESEENAAVREFYEETNIQLNQTLLKKIGGFELHKFKDIVLFLYIADKLPDVYNMKCNSFFKKDNLLIPEVNNCMYINIKDMKKWIRNDMYEKLYFFISKEFK